MTPNVDNASLATAASAVLSGQIAVVTGAARGIGAAISLQLASLGAHVVLVARDGARLKAVAEQITAAGGSAEPQRLDLLDPAAIEAFGQVLREKHGRCDILVNNAGLGKLKKPLHEVELAEWETMIDTNLRAPYLLIRAFAPLMIEQKSGHIINVASLAGHNPLPNGAPYSASKWGLNGLTYSVAEELRPYGVRVAVVAPGSVNTEFGSGPSDRDARKLQPEDVAKVVAMLVTQAPQSFISEVLMRPTSKT